jgi:hypothetical protein
VIDTDCIQHINQNFTALKPYKFVPVKLYFHSSRDYNPTTPEDATFDRNRINEMIEFARNEVTIELGTIAATFKKMDTDKSGSIDEKELGGYINSLHELNPGVLPEKLLAKHCH